MRSLEAKIVVLGSQGVGKTSLVVRYVGNTFNKHVSPTIGASFFTCKMQINDYRVKLQVWDTAGQERFRSMAPMYYRRSNAALLVYDITSMDSFVDMQAWVTELKKNVETRLVMCVLGNKCDLREERRVPVDEAEQFAASIGAIHLETSALSNEGIQEVFGYVAQYLIKLYEDRQSSDMYVMDSYSTLHSDSSIALHNDSTLSEQDTSGATGGQQKKGWCCSS